MNDEQILQRGGTEEDIIKEAENNGADLIEDDLSDFKRELASVLNKYSRENLSNTPDYILAEYLNDCLDTFDKIIQLKEKNNVFSPESEKKFYEIAFKTTKERNTFIKSLGKLKNSPEKS
jgi:hypothetical protein